MTALVLSMTHWIDRHVPACCQPARCRCDCGCRQHSHFFRCGDCAYQRHAPPRPVLVPLTVSAAIAFAEWPPRRPAPLRDPLAHLRRFMTEPGPRLVED